METPPAQVRRVIMWCLPSLIGFPLFLLSFPIDRAIGWRQVNVAEVFLFWFLLIAPVGIIIASVNLIRARKRGVFATPVAVLAWTVITISVLANLFMLLGLWASTY